MLTKSLVAVASVKMEFSKPAEFENLPLIADNDYIGSITFLMSVVSQFYAQNLLFCLTVEEFEELPDYELYVSNRGLVYVYWPCIYASGKKRWGHLKLRNADPNECQNKNGILYLPEFDFQSNQYDAQQVTSQDELLGISKYREYLEEQDFIPKIEERVEQEVSL